MIKINLLPVRAAKKKETAVQQIAVLCIGIVVVAVVCLGMYTYKRVQIATAKQEISDANSKIEELKKKIGKLEALKNLKDQVKKKLDVLAQLRKNKTGPAQRLASLSDITPDQLWLTAYSENASEVRISGIAYTEELIASFMKSLEASANFMGVELIVSEQTMAGDVKVKKFDLACRIETTAPPTPAGPPKK